MKKLLLFCLLASGAAYGMDEKRMLTELLALQRIQVGKDLVKMAGQNICTKCGSDKLEITNGSNRLCRWCLKEIDLQELRALAPHGLDLVRAGITLLNTVQEHHRAEPDAQPQDHQTQEEV
jgi:hypothetical protein